MNKFQIDLIPDFLTDVKVLTSMAIAPIELRPFIFLAYKLSNTILLTETTEKELKKSFIIWSFYNRLFKKRITCAHREEWDDEGTRDFSVFHTIIGSGMHEISCLYAADCDCVDKGKLSIRERIV